jgi:hypothetical protein
MVLSKIESYPRRGGQLKVFVWLYLCFVEDTMHFDSTQNSLPIPVKEESNYYNTLTSLYTKLRSLYSFPTKGNIATTRFYYPKTQCFVKLGICVQREVLEYTRIFFDGKLILLSRN